MGGRRCGERQFDRFPEREPAAGVHDVVPAPVAEASARGVEVLLLECGHEVGMGDRPDRGRRAEQAGGTLEAVLVGGDRGEPAHSFRSAGAKVVVTA
jgi:hypothetical protein